MLLDEANDNEMIPPPPKLVRQRAYNPYTDDVWTVDAAMVTRYLQYEIRYSALTPKNVGLTWGQLIDKDYAEFVELMTYSVAVDSNTFMALKGHLKTPGEVEHAQAAIRHSDTDDGKKKTQEKFLALTCGHKGAMNGKTWGEIRKLDYSYFLWSVANSMGRETKSFDVLVQCLTEKDRITVLTTPKGQLVVPRKRANKK
jgi:hypothetical protein